MAVDQAWLERLDAATNYKTLFESVFYAVHHVADDEAWAECPVHDDCDDPGKFSFNLKDGKWGCFKHDEHGSMLGLLRDLKPKSWRDVWIQACPAAKDVFGIEKKVEKNSTAPGKKVDHPSIARDGALATTDADLQPLADKWQIPLAVLREQGWFVLRGGREGAEHPKYCLPIHDVGGKVVGIRIRFLPPYPKVKDKKGEEHEVKSRVMSGSTTGFFGLSRLSAVTSEGLPLPVLLGEGEKDWAVTSFEQQGYCVLSPSHGSGSDVSPLVEVLRGRDVTVLYDEDEAGNKGSRKALTQLLAATSALKWAHIGQPKKDVFNIVRDDGGGKAALDAVLDHAEPFSMGEALKDVAAVIAASIDEDEDTDVVEISKTIFNVLKDAGALWLKTRNGLGFCVWNGRVYACEKSDAGWALRIGEWTGIDSFGSIGSRIHQQIAAMAVEQGQPCDETAWFARVGDGVCLPLCDPAQRLVEILPSGLTVRPNGHSGVVVLPSPNMRPIVWNENFNENDVRVEWQKFLSMFTCSNEDRRLIEALILMMPLYDWIDTHPLIRFSGAPGSGKSTAAKLITVLIYGDERLFTATNAAMYRMGVNYPLICLDNIEAAGVDENLELFFLLAATGAEKIKSAMDSSSKIITERVRSWVLTTGVDPITFGKRELVERSLIIPFGGNTTDSFMPRAAMAWVRERRDKFWNFIFRRAWQTVSSLASGGLDRVVATLPRTSRPRLREFYALASMSLGRDMTMDESISWLLDEHVETETTTSVEDNPLVDLLAFVPAFLKTMAGKDLGVKVAETSVGWQLDWMQTQRLGVIFSSVARAIGRPYPFRSTQQMAVRLGLVAPQLNTLGFKVERNENLLIEGKRLRAWRIYIPRHLGHADASLIPEAAPE